MVTGMAEVIEYYVPERFRKKTRWIPPDQRGKLVQFPCADGEHGARSVQTVATQPVGGDVDCERFVSPAVFLSSSNL